MNSLHCMFNFARTFEYLTFLSSLFQTYSLLAAKAALHAAICAGCNLCFHEHLSVRYMCDL